MTSTRTSRIETSGSVSWRVPGRTRPARICSTHRERQLQLGRAARSPNRRASTAARPARLVRRDAAARFAARASKSARTAATRRDRLLSVERQTRTRGDETRAVTEFSIVTDSGELRTFELTPSVRIRVTERELRQEIGRYLDLVGSIREQDVRSMTISSVGSGERPLFVSYISEVPIWKSTYRLVLPVEAVEAAAAGLGDCRQHHRRRLDIGRAVARRGRSAVVHPADLAALLRPAPGRAAAEPHPARAADASGHARRANCERTRRRKPELDVAGRDRLACKAEHRRFKPVRPRFAAASAAASRVRSGPSYEQFKNMAPAAAAGDMGDLFEYRIVEPVTLTKNQSALVPIVNTEIDAERVSLWNRSSGSGSLKLPDREPEAPWKTSADG